MGQDELINEFDGEVLYKYWVLGYSNIKRSGGKELAQRSGSW
jgi:hypothetical protein